jgi:hypothetical protein
MRNAADIIGVIIDSEGPMRMEDNETGKAPQTVKRGYFAGAAGSVIVFVGMRRRFKEAWDQPLAESSQGGNRGGACLMIRV